jgi:hypothetical protein
MTRLLTVKTIRHLGRDGEVLWEQREVPNIWHRGGEVFCLGVLFNSAETALPANYYCGLDNRSSLAVSDTLANLSQEPTQFGYGRQAISSASGFTIDLNEFDVYQATSGVLTFEAVGGTWGPVRNIFLATSLSSGGVLMSTAALDGSRSVADGEKLSLQIGLTLRDASTATFPD